MNINAASEDALAYRGPYYPETGQPFNCLAADRSEPIPHYCPHCGRWLPSDQCPENCPHK